jgi:hypothetical protein
MFTGYGSQSYFWSPQSSLRLFFRYRAQPKVGAPVQSLHHGKPWRPCKPLELAASIALLQSRTKKAEHGTLSAEVDSKSTLGLSACSE